MKAVNRIHLYQHTIRPSPVQTQTTIVDTQNSHFCRILWKTLLFLCLIFVISIFPHDSAYAYTYKNDRNENINYSVKYKNGEIRSESNGRNLLMMGAGGFSDNAWMISLAASISGDYSGTIEYKQHVNYYGWQGKASNGAWTNVINHEYNGDPLWIEAISMRLSGDVSNYYYLSYDCFASPASWNYIHNMWGDSRADGDAYSKYCNGQNNGVWNRWINGLECNGAADYEGLDNAQKYELGNWAGTYGYWLATSGFRASIYKFPCTVNIDTDGGSFETNSVTGAADGTLIFDNVPTKEGWIFDGWDFSYTYYGDYDSSVRNQKPASNIAPGISMSGSQTTISMGNAKTITIKAKWRIGYYTMTTYHKQYNVNTGNWDVFQITTAQAMVNSIYAPSYITPPTGFHRHSRDWEQGWTVTGNGSFSVYYYPNTYRIGYNSNDGNGNTKFQSVLNTQTVNLDKNEFTRDGYAFRGWSLTPTGYVSYTDGQAVKDLYINSGKTIYNDYDYYPVFDYKYYADHNPDIKAAFGYNQDLLLSHFVNNGMAEGRIASPEFDINYYKSHYADLMNAWTDNRQYYYHYINHGRSENRCANETGGSITLYAQWDNLNPENVKLFAENGDDTYVVTDTSATDTIVSKWVNTPYELYANAEDSGDGIAKAVISRADAYSNAKFDTKMYDSVPKLTRENATFKSYNKEGTTSLVLTVTDTEGAKSDRTYTGSTSTKKMTLKIDNTAPHASITATLGTYGSPLNTISTKSWQDWKVYNSMAYGSKVVINLSDENENAAGGKQDVSGIKQARMTIYDTDNPENRTDIELIADNEQGVTTYTYDETLDINTMFSNVMNLTYEVHAIDVAGNEMPVVTTTTERKPEVYAKIEKLTTDDLGDAGLFKAGYRGRLYIYTTGWVDTLSLSWPETITKSSIYDVAHGEIGMLYDACLITNGMSQGMNLSDNIGIRTLQQMILSSEDVDYHNPSNKAFSIDVDGESTEFTRCYVFDFWIPVYIGLPENPNHIDMDTVSQINTKITANKYLLHNLDGTVTIETVTSAGFANMRLGDGSIMDEFHSSIIN